MAIPVTSLDRYYDSTNIIRPIKGVTLLNADGTTYQAAAPVLPAAVVAGVQTTTASALALANHPLTQGVALKAPAANTGTVYVGPAGVTAANGYPLAAGEAISFATSNTNSIFIVGTNTTDTIAYAGS